MAKGSNKNATKSFVMLIVTGVVLVAVTLCWFAINGKSSVDSVDSAVNNDASSKATLFVGVTADEEIAIRSGDVDHYVPVKSDDEAIVLENMIPGAEYFYKAEFADCSAGQTITLGLDGIVGGSPSLKNAITVSRLIEKDDGTANKTSTGQNVQQLNKSSFTYTVTEEGKHAVYFSFVFSNDAKVEDYGNASVTINEVNIVLSD